jgi:predicted anti-sigma-YlaC factor YlaD
MTCSQCREVLSARLDGEERPEERARVEVHLGVCAACRRFAERAAHITRLARTELVGPVPDLVDSVLAAAPRPRQRRRGRGRGGRRGLARWGTVLRVLLATIGIGQFGLATGDVLSLTDHEHDGSGFDGASLIHFVHESLAWNLALAVGFLGVAARPSRMRGILPLVGAFVGGLTALSATDMVAGLVTGPRLLAHGLVVLGLLVLACLARARPDRGAPEMTPSSV